MARPMLRAGVAAASAALAALVGWALKPEPSGATVELVDSRAEIRALLEQAAEAPAPPVDKGLTRVPVDAKTAQLFYPAISKNHVYDPHLLSRRTPHDDLWMPFPDHPNRGFKIRTNSLGLREDEEVSEQKPDVRVLVVGDSHVDGLLDNADSFPNLLERELRRRHPERSIEVLNGGAGGWNFYNYLGALEGLADLQPDVFVLVCYGGNDFQGAMSLHHFHRREAPPASEGDSIRAVLKLGEVPGGVGLPAQFLVQAAYFRDHPGEEAAALDMAVAVTAEVERQCRARGIGLLCVYLPPWLHGQPEVAGPLAADALARAPLDDAHLLADERLADAWLAWLSEAGVAAVDLRPAFRSIIRQPLYWKSDHHLNIAGHRAAAHALVERLAELCGLPR